MCNITVIANFAQEATEVMGVTAARSDAAFRVLRCSTATRPALEGI